MMQAGDFGGSLVMRCYSGVRALLCLLLTLTAAQACGPDFSPDIFVRPNRPDLPAQYVAGRLGLLQTSYPRADLLVAYRYLNGGSLDASEQKGWQPTYSIYEQEAPGFHNASSGAEPVSALAQWVLARGTYPDAPPGPIGQQRGMRVSVGVNSNYTYETSFLNCADDAFRTAAATLKDRAGRWTEKSPYLRDWIRAQDAVFGNCSGGTSLPADAPAGGPALLVSDRAYQKAAAHFYSLALPAATGEFLAISRDKASPWQPIAGYLAARVMIRQAFLAKPGDVDPEGSYDPALLQAAARQLRSYLAGEPPEELRRAAEAALALVRIRIEPDARARELGALIAGPQHDDNYAQDLTDLLWLMSAKTPDGLRAQPETWMQVKDEQHPGLMRSATAAEIAQDVNEKRHNAYGGSAAVRKLSPAIDWTLTMQALDPAAGIHALAEWERTRTLPWLVAALSLAPGGAAATPGLLEAAAGIPIGSPGWQTATYHRVRLLLARGDAGEARAVLAGALPKVEGEPSSVNAFRGLAMRAAPTLAGFLEYVPRTMLMQPSEDASAVQDCREVMKDPRRHYNCVEDVSATQLDVDAAGILNTQAPLAIWLEAAKSSALSVQLRQALAEAGWARAVLLKDRQAAAGFLTLLPEALRVEIGSGSELEQWMVLARNPGLNPYLDGGTQRGYAYDFVESYRDNWCYKPSDMGRLLSASFLDREAKVAGARQAQALASIRAATLGQQMVDYVSAHPEEPRGAEALFLILRMIRYGCTEAAAPPAAAGSAGGQYLAVQPSEEAMHLFRLKQEASRLLRRRYAASPWTKKAAPFAG